MVSVNHLLVEHFSFYQHTMYNIHVGQRIRLETFVHVCNCDCGKFGIGFWIARTVEIAEWSEVCSVDTVEHSNAVCNAMQLNGAIDAMHVHIHWQPLTALTALTALNSTTTHSYAHSEWVAIQGQSLGSSPGVRAMVYYSSQRILL